MFGWMVGGFEGYHNDLDFVSGLLEQALPGEVFLNPPNGHVWSESSGESGGGTGEEPPG